MEKRFYFDVMDDDVPPVVYHLMFAFTCGTGNNRVHAIDPDDLALQCVTRMKYGSISTRGYSLSIPATAEATGLASRK